MANNEEKINSKKINLILRSSDLKFFFLYNSVMSIIILILVNLIPFNIDKKEYFNLIIENNLFNFIISSILFFVTTNIYAYYLYIESRIQFKNRKFYLVDVDTFKNIFSIFLSIFFGLIISIFIFISILVFWKKLIGGDNPLTPINKFFITSALFFVLPWILISSYYYRGIRFILYNFLFIWNNLTSSTRISINDEIYHSKMNNTPLCLIIFQITNTNNISKEIGINKNSLIKVICNELKKNVRNTDFVLILNHNKSKIGFIIDSDNKRTELQIKEKILPFFENNIKIKNNDIHLEINYDIYDLATSKEINNLKDIFKLAK